jgi:hypothetical protein
MGKAGTLGPCNTSSRIVTTSHLEYNPSPAKHHFSSQEEEEEAIELLMSGLKDLMQARECLHMMRITLTRINSSRGATIPTLFSSDCSSTAALDTVDTDNYDLDRRLESKGYVAASIHKYEIAKSLLGEELPKIRAARVYPDKMRDSQVRNALKKRPRILRSLAEVENMILDYSSLVAMMQGSTR